MIPPEWLDPPDFRAAAVAQRGLAALLRHTDSEAPVRFVGGADTSCARFDPARRVAAAIVVLALPGLERVASASAVQVGARPYVPGFLGFREVPALLEAWAALEIKPDLLLVDGHGIAHPRRFGVAAHLGVVLDVPTIGVAKSLLVGGPAAPVPDVAGAEAPLLVGGEVVGACLRMRRGAGPVYVSPGHRVSVAAAAGWVWRCGAGRRLPEPTREAHAEANAARLTESRSRGLPPGG